MMILTRTRRSAILLHFRCLSRCPSVNRYLLKLPSGSVHVLPAELIRGIVRGGPSTPKCASVCLSSTDFCARLMCVRQARLQVRRGCRAALRAGHHASLGCGKHVAVGLFCGSVVPNYVNAGVAPIETKRPLQSEVRFSPFRSTRLLVRC